MDTYNLKAFDMGDCIDVTNGPIDYRFDITGCNVLRSNCKPEHITWQAAHKVARAAAIKLRRAS